MVVWVVNDRLTAIPGTRTMWHELLDLVPGSVFVAVDYGNPRLPMSQPDLVIRPASYFGPLPVTCPQVVFFQEIHEPRTATRSVAVAAASNANLIVWNSSYTKSHYPELAHKESLVVPIGTDAAKFQLGKDHGAAVLWVGAPSYIKGWPLFLELASRMDAQFCVVSKQPVHEAWEKFVVHTSVRQETLAALMGRCRLALCTSEVETQHLAGIEAGLCGVPIVTRRLGAYADLQDGPWGSIVERPYDVDEWLAKIDKAPPPGPQVRQHWLDAGYDLETWKRKWTEIVGRFVNVVA